MAGNRIIEGYYSINYTGLVGSGFGIIVLDTNMVVGADAAGGVWDGTYQHNRRTDELDANLTIKLPPDVFSALSGQQSTEPHIERFEVSLPKDLGAEKVMTLHTSLGFPVSVVIKKVRDFPN